MKKGSSPLINILMAMTYATMATSRPRKEVEAIYYKRGNTYWRKVGDNKPEQISKIIYDTNKGSDRR